MLSALEICENDNRRQKEQLGAKMGKIKLQNDDDISQDSGDKITLERVRFDFKKGKAVSEDRYAP